MADELSSGWDSGFDSDVVDLAADVGAPRDLDALETSLETDFGEVADEVERGRQLDRDARVVEQLRKHGCGGPLYDLVVDEVMPYGYKTLLKMMNNGSVFGRCAAQGRPVPEGMVTNRWAASDRKELAVDTAVDGLKVFRDHGLLGGLWHPGGGATLATYFVGACLRCFGRRYVRWFRQWCKQQSELSAADPDGFGAQLAEIPDQRAVDPAQAALLRVDLEMLLGEQPMLVRRGLVLQAMGLTGRETATELNITAKAWEHRRSAAHKRIREQYSDEADGRGRDAR